MATHSSILAWRIPWTEETGRLTVHGVTKRQTWLRDLLEKEKATHSSFLAWRIPGTEEPGGLPSLGSHRVRHNWSDLAAAYMFVCLYVYVDTHIYIGFIFLWELWIIYGAKGWKIRWNLEGNFKDLVSTLNEMVNHYRGGHNLAFVLKVSHHRLLCWEKIIMRPGWKLLQ